MLDTVKIHANAHIQTILTCMQQCDYSTLHLLLKTITTVITKVQFLYSPSNRRLAWDKKTYIWNTLHHQAHKAGMNDAATNLSSRGKITTKFPLLMHSNSKPRKLNALSSNEKTMNMSALTKPDTVRIRVRNQLPKTSEGLETEPRRKRRCSPFFRPQTRETGDRAAKREAEELLLPIFPPPMREARLSSLLKHI